MVSLAPTARRWLDILGYSIGACILGPLVAALYLAAWKYLLQYWPEAWPSLGGGLFRASSILLIIAILLGAKIRLRQFQHFWRYPPFLVSPLLVATLACAAGSIYPKHLEALAVLSGTAGKAAFLALWIFLGAVLPFVYALRNRTRSRSRQTTGSVGCDLTTLSWDELIEWLREERPSVLPQRDFFGASLRALRILHALERRPAERARGQFMQTMVVQGAFGSGKTTVVKQVKGLIARGNESGYVFVEVSAWGFSSDAARYQILERAIDALNDHVDTLAIRRVPQEYADALSAGGKWLSALLNPWLSDPSPSDRLRQLTPILHAIRSNLVIAIEDSDRTGPDFDPQHFQAMLDDFRRVEHLSFILTVGNKRQFDFPKIAEQIETIPSLREFDVAHLTDRVRDHCLGTWPVIDWLTDERNRPKSLVSVLDATREIKWRRWGMKRWPTHVVNLLGTPRSLKIVLRSVVDSWERLHGEVDLDELIIVTTLRYVAGPVFSFLLRRFADLQVLGAIVFDQKQQDQSNDKISELRTEWKAAVAECEGDPNSIEGLVQDTFPAGGPLTAGRRFYHHSNRIQSLRSDRGEAYFERIVSGEIISNVVRDQEVLRLLTDALKDQKPNAFAARFAASRDFAEIALFFDRPVGGWRSVKEQDRLKIASAILDQFPLISKDGSLDRVPNYALLLEWVHGVDTSGQPFADWVKNEAAKHVSKRLGYVTALHMDLMKEQYVPKENIAAVRTAIIDMIRTELPPLSSIDLAKCFPRDEPYTLWLLVHEVIQQAQSVAVACRPSSAGASFVTR